MAMDAGNRKGFYVKMRILHNKHGGRPEKSSSKTPFCYRYFKWFLWISVGQFCIYFFISLLFNYKPSSTSSSITSLSRTTISLSKSSRALFEQQPLTHPDEQLDKIRKTDRFKPDKAFVGTNENVGQRDGPVEFDRMEAEEADPFGLDQFLTEVKKGKKAMDKVGSGGTMKASAGYKSASLNQLQMFLKFLYSLTSQIQFEPTVIIGCQPIRFEQTGNIFVYDISFEPDVMIVTNC